MRTRAVDNNWDWKWGKSNQDYTKDSLSVAYSVKMKILSWYKDCFFAQDEGIDWKNILGSKVSKKAADDAIKEIIRQEDEILDLTRFESEVVDRSYTATVRFTTIYGETIEVRI